MYYFQGHLFLEQRPIWTSCHSHPPFLLNLNSSLLSRGQSMSSKNVISDPWHPSSFSQRHSASSCLTFPASTPGFDPPTARSCSIFNHFHPSSSLILSLGHSAEIQKKRNPEEKKKETQTSEPHTVHLGPCFFCLRDQDIRFQNIFIYLS